METSLLLSLVTALGFGGLFGALVQHALMGRSELARELRAINEEKYRTLLMYMSMALDANNRRHFMMKDNELPKLSTEEIPAYSLEKVREYYYHSVLSSSDSVLIALKDFLQKPCRKSFIEAATQMRKELWGNKTSLSSYRIEIDRESTSNITKKGTGDGSLALTAPVL